MNEMSDPRGFTVLLFLLVGPIVIGGGGWLLWDWVRTVRARRRIRRELREKWVDFPLPLDWELEKRLTRQILQEEKANRHRGQQDEG